MSSHFCETLILNLLLFDVNSFIQVLTSPTCGFIFLRSILVVIIIRQHLHKLTLHDVLTDIAEGMPAQIFKKKLHYFWITKVLGIGKLRICWQRLPNDNDSVVLVLMAPLIECW